MITGTFRKRLENLQRDYARMGLRCYRKHQRAGEGTFQGKLLRSAAFLHLNASSAMGRVLETGRFSAFLYRLSRRLPFTLPGLLTGPERRKLQKLMWGHARRARTCIRDGVGAFHSGRFEEYRLFCHASFMNLNTAREIEAVLFHHRAPGLRNDDFLFSFTGGLEKP